MLYGKAAVYINIAPNPEGVADNHPNMLESAIVRKPKSSVWSSGARYEKMSLEPPSSRRT